MPEHLHLPTTAAAKTTVPRPCPMSRKLEEGVSLYGSSSY